MAIDTLTFLPKYPRPPRARPAPEPHPPPRSVVSLVGDLRQLSAKSSKEMLMSYPFLWLCVMWLAYLIGKVYLYELGLQSERGKSFWETILLLHAKRVTRKYAGVRRRTAKQRFPGYAFCIKRWIGHPDDCPPELKAKLKADRAKSKRAT